MSFAEAHALRENYVARKAKLDFEVASGALVEIEVVGQEVEACFAVVRERLLSIPGKLADKLVGRERAYIENAILAEISEALEEISSPADLTKDVARKGSK
ncbi:hypothetical protein CR492_03140 [Methylocella silvestris]|uniref:Uncharacterized protein n=2 Tax=Methylocella silvestris TaxID=199596 RepID=A0A2J7TM92_METSI|nr:hypothetical protein CR492_03140 [Methylocella silvestris]